MFFSVLIPVYNVEQYLPECIESVLNQDEQDFEIILVDDGSTDSSGAICDEYSARYPDRIRVIHKENEGLLLTRRRTIREAKGEWFVHLDSDDYLLPGALKTIRQALDDSGADMLIGNFIYGQSNQADMSKLASIPFNNLELFENSSKHKLIMQFLYGGSITAIWQKVVKRELVDIQEDYKSVCFVSLMEDHLQSLPLIDAATRIIFINTPIIYYRLNKESITKRKGVDAYYSNYRSLCAVYRTEEVYRKKWGLTSKEDALVFAKHLKRIAMIVRNIISETSPEERRQFLVELSANRDLEIEFQHADKTALGKKNEWLFSLVFHGCYGLLKIYCKIIG